MDSDEILQAYINKMLTLQGEQRDRPFSNAELKQIALDLGMSEEDWLESQKAYQGHLSSGKGHLNYKNWKDAIKELENATALNPNEIEAVAGLAQAYKGYWLETENDQYKKQAEKYAERALQINPGHKQAVFLLGELRQGEKHVAKKKNSRQILWYGIVGAVVLFFALMYFTISNSINTQKELVKQKWAQVENVYERRANLIPNIVRTVKESVKFDKEILDKLSKTFNEAKNMKANVENLSSYQNTQDELSVAIQDLLNQASRSTILKSNDAFQTLMVEVEGSENRITQERRKYNEEVGKYNAKIQQFPNSLLGYPAIEYLKMQKGADKAPKIDFN